MTQVILKKISHFTPILTYTPNKLENRKGMVKTFWPLKTLFHTYTHTLSCIPGEFQVFYRVLIHILLKMDGKMDEITGYLVI